MRIHKSYNSKTALYNNTLKGVNILLGIGIAVLVVIILLILIQPIQPKSQEVSVNTLKPLLDRELNELLAGDTSKDNSLAQMVRTGLFKSATPLRNKPMADRTVERIKSKLKLKCVMEINQEPTAYINIEGVGLKQCRVGQSVNDLFTVLSIDKDSVGISIVEHKVVLRM